MTHKIRMKKIGVIIFNLLLPIPVRIFPILDGLRKLNHTSIDRNPKSHSRSIPDKLAAAATEIFEVHQIPVKCHSANGQRISCGRHRMICSVKEYSHSMRTCISPELIKKNFKIIVTWIPILEIFGMPHLGNNIANRVIRMLELIMNENLPFCNDLLMG